MKYIPFFFILLLFLAACDSTDPDEEGVGEEEAITTVRLTLEAPDRSTIMAEWQDLDGDGGNAPTFDPLVIESGVAYTGAIVLLDESDASDVEDITEEVEEEAEEHQFFYTVEGGLVGNLTVNITDQDANGLPVGLEFTVEAAQSGSGVLRVVLSHYDEAPKDGVTRSPETDVEIAWPVTVN